MIDNKEYLTLKQDVLDRLSVYSHHKNTNILYLLKQESAKDNVLQLLLQKFYKEDNDVTRLNYAEEILIRLTNADKLNMDLFGKHINSRHLFVLDILNELNFISFSLNSIRDIFYTDTRIKTNFEVIKISEFSTHLAIAQRINLEFEDLKFNIYSKLVNYLSSSMEVPSTRKITDLSSFIDTFGIAMLRNKESGKQIIVEALKAFERHNLLNRNNNKLSEDENAYSFENDELMNSINYLYS